MKKAILFLLSLCLQTAQAQEISAILSNIVENNLELKAARQGAAADIAEMQSENALGETSVEYSPFYQGGVSGVSSSELIVSQQFDFPSLFVARSRRNAQQQTALNLEYEILKRDILLRATTLCYDLYTAQQRQQLVGLRLSDIDSLQNFCQRQLEQGEATIIDLNRIKIDRMGLDAERLEILGERERLQSELRLLSPALAEEIMIEGNPREELAPVLLSLESNNPSQAIALAEANLRTAETEVRIARQGWLPTLTAGYRRNTDLHDAQNGLLIGASIPLFSNSKKIHAAKLRQEARQTELDNKRNEQQTTIQALIKEAQNLEAQLRAFDLHLLQSQQQILLRAVTAGQLSITEYYAEAEKILQLQQSRLETENRFNKAVATLRSQF